MEFIKTLDAKEPRALLTKDRSTVTPRVPVFIPERIGREERKNLYSRRLPFVRILYASLGLEKPFVLFFRTEPPCNIRPPSSSTTTQHTQGRGRHLPAPGGDSQASIPPSCSKHDAPLDAAGKASLWPSVHKRCPLRILLLPEPSLDQSLH